MSHTIQERVAKGAALLDEKQPGWHEKVNAATLDIGSCGRCVLGQLFGSYISGVNELNLWDRATTRRELGFAGALDNSEYDRLLAEWIRVIEARAEGAAQ